MSQTLLFMSLVLLCGHDGRSERERERDGLAAHFLLNFSRFLKSLRGSCGGHTLHSGGDGGKTVYPVITRITSSERGQKFLPFHI